MARDLFRVVLVGRFAVARAEQVLVPLPDVPLELRASQIPGLAGAVVWYGFPPLEYIDATKITVPVLGHWATQDAFFNIDVVATLEAKLREANVNVEFHRYLAHHAFANETAVGPGRIPQTQYDPVWSQLAWDRTLTFFGRTLWS